ncbi:methyltransferase domain-containing protein [Microbacterium sp. KSW4-16]|uniref:class I SAM-dependent methyltransferase n=1 Tax=Microbacterium TaxID=33882 RepID=UPI00103C97BC|nr:MULTISPECIES: class I SAM-dependent methyltransferase [Microbacterium]MCK8466194.1 methyltransferase domain-containing protein [Microbacterium aurugineum]TCJ29570.1 SAM-dependent methyltransferase [Microbacterium sp. PI-1]
MKDWSGVGDAYSASYAALCAGTFSAMREVLGEGNGRSLVDVGAGDGTLAARWAADGWTVTTCEPEPTMRAASRRLHPRIETIDGALPTLPFAEGEFDVAIANFVLNHVDSPRSAAAELRRVSRGVVVATVWTLSPSWLWAEITERAGIAPFVGARLSDAEDFERTSDGFGRMLHEAGLPHVAVTEIDWIWNADPDSLWLSVDGGVAGAGALYAGLDQAERQRFRTAFDTVVEERSVRGSLPLEHRAAIAVSAGR